MPFALFFASTALSQVLLSLVNARLVGRFRPRTLIGFGLTMSSTAVILLTVGVLFLGTPAPVPAAPQPLVISLFRNPVVPGVVISGYFDHNPNAGWVTHYNGRTQAGSGAGYYFSCSTPNMYDWVACEDNVSGEQNCSNNRELWYDGHKGIDYEFSSAWHTGAACDPGRFSGLTMPIYAPAAGRVTWAGYDPARPGNGWHIRIKHDVNRNGSYDDDGLRSNFLHFTANSLAVTAGQIVQDGQYLGLGGTTGYSSSPHLHFEIQRSSDNFTGNVWSVDPYGWMGPGSDPWPYKNESLWRVPTIDMPYRKYLPYVSNQPSGACPDCAQLLQNNGFEAGESGWNVSGLEVIVNNSRVGLPIFADSGSWLAWLGGRNNGRDSISQDFLLPSNLNTVNLRYRLAVTSEETTHPFDSMSVRLRTTNGDLIADLETINDGYQPLNQWTTREISLPILLSWTGQTVRLSFEAATDDTNRTSFFLDEISVIVTRP
jgi:murein DD-endopeptidase MepM/ murein hydrolase activator NlpD